MDNCSIIHIFSEEYLKRTVRVKMIRDYYDGKKEVTAGFLSADWKKYKKYGRYPDFKDLDEGGIAYFENMSDEEWHKGRYGAKLRDFSDEEIVEELNRRMTPWSKIRIESKVVIKEK